jgi:hypothetical protein
MKERIAFWVSQRHSVPYRFRKSFVKRACPKILSDYQFEINCYGMKYAGNTKNHTDRLFLMFGGCKKYILSFMKDFYASVKKNDFEFVDIGTHVGNHSLFMAGYANKIHAFEPNLSAREALKKRVTLNGLKNINIYPFGLSNRSEKILFNGSELEFKIGDDLIAQEKISYVDLIKIDAEGYEREVVDGLKNSVKESRPAIIMQVSGITRKFFGSKNDFESIFPKDYCFFQFAGISREKDNYTLAEFDYEQHLERMDIVAIPKEKSQFLIKKITKKVNLLLNN